MNAKTLPLLGLLLSLTSAAKAQVSDALAQTSFEYFPKADNQDTGESIGVNVARAAAFVPIPVAKRTLLIAGVAYELLDIHPSNSPSFQLHAPKATFGVIQGFSDHWGMMAFGDVGVASDFSDELSSEDALASLTGIGTYKLNESFTIGAGAVYDRRTGKLAPLPALLLSWRISERARVRGFMPAYVAAEYRTTDWLDLGVRAAFEGNRFHLGQEKFQLAKLELAYANLDVGPKLTFNLSDWVHFDVYAAAAVYRRYELFQDDESFAKYKLSPVVAYGARFWIGPSQWNAPKAAE
jgi:hypothetical protein